MEKGRLKSKLMALKELSLVFAYCLIDGITCMNSYKLKELTEFQYAEQSSPAAVIEISLKYTRPIWKK